MSTGSNSSNSEALFADEMRRRAKKNITFYEFIVHQMSLSVSFQGASFASITDWPVVIHEIRYANGTMSIKKLFHCIKKDVLKDVARQVASNAATRSATAVWATLRRTTQKEIEADELLLRFEEVASGADVGLVQTGGQTIGKPLSASTLATGSSTSSNLAPRDSAPGVGRRTSAASAAEASALFFGSHSVEQENTALLFGRKRTTSSDVSLSTVAEAAHVASGHAAEPADDEDDKAFLASMFGVDVAKVRTGKSPDAQ